MGKERAYRMGIWARERYNHLINGKEYHAELLNMISSHSERSVMSGQLFLHGFYPPTSEENEIWNARIPWQPIPVYTCLLYTSPSPRDRTRSRMPSSA